MKKEHVMFVGERVDWRGNIYQCFKNKAGVESHFKGVKNVCFGSVYNVEDGRIARIPVAIEPPPWHPTDKECLEHEAQKIAVYERRALNRKALQLKKPHADIAKAVELLAPFYLSMDDFTRMRFMRWFSNECSKKVKK
jgi:hypothetical protein